MVVAAAVHDGHQAILVEPLEADHRRMKSKAIGEFDRLAFGNAEIRSGAIVGGIAESGRSCSSRHCRLRAR